MEVLKAQHTELQPCSVSVLGATGSVGKTTLQVLRENPGKFQVSALTAHSNVVTLAEAAVEFHAHHAVIADDTLYNDLKERLAGTGISVAAGAGAVVDAAEMEADKVVSAIVGIAGLKPTLAALRKGRVVALANKESIVCGGAHMMDTARKYNAEIIPVDSEHNAIYQLFDFDRPETVSRVILTASGGPFLNKAREELHEITPTQACAHPTWSMGAKISVDSATMMNKALEMIEAKHLFDLSPDQIDVLIHPQSIVHSMVEYHDGTLLSQMGLPDMSGPVSFALGWPDRLEIKSKNLGTTHLNNLTFLDPDVARFPALSYARQAMNEGSVAQIALNAANEVAVAAFLSRKIKFTDIETVISYVLEQVSEVNIATVENILDVDMDSRRVAEHVIISKISA